ncbi:MAG: bacteriohemerythrin [Candidatus Contendobacter sp.]|jgi:hemerythrin|nr:hemerythrin family protein [Gammaproteobacteria bacterium]MCC8995232.1 bacteriohemerythrin [Candidatus Contendobacter sp.]
MTAFIEWSNELSVGIEEIDAQHKVLVDLLNQIHEAIQQRHGAEITGRILQKLGEYTRIHFAVEESLMRIMHYPDYERHKLEHDKLIDQLNVFQAKLADGKISISFELAHFLKAWLTKHIMGTDKYYTPYFLEQGIRPELAKTSWVKKLWGSLRSGS